MGRYDVCEFPSFGRDVGEFCSFGSLPAHGGLSKCYARNNRLGYFGLHIWLRARASYLGTAFRGLWKATDLFGVFLLLHAFQLGMCAVKLDRGPCRLPLLSGNVCSRSGDRFRRSHCRRLGGPRPRTPYGIFRSGTLSGLGAGSHDRGIHGNRCRSMAIDLLVTVCLFCVVLARCSCVP